jgi:hypothetical protein
LHENETKVGDVIGIVFGMLIVFHWGTNINKNIVHVMVSGVTNNLWRGGSGACSECDVTVSISEFTRAITLSFGSICCGSLLTSILQTLDDFCRFLQWLAQEKKNYCAGCILCCVECCLSCTTYLVKMFNTYAYCYCACYGYSYFTAAGEAANLLMRDGLSAVVNDNLVSNVMWLGCLVVGALTCFLGIHFTATIEVQQAIIDVQGGSATAAYDWSDTVRDAATVVGLIGFLAGYTTCHVLTHGTITAGVATVFVCFVDNPDGLKYHHPSLHQKLESAYLNICPDFAQQGSYEMEGGGYKAPNAGAMTRAGGRNAL